MKDILDVIFDYSLKQKYLDQNAIEKIVKAYIKEFNIDIISKVNVYRKFELLFGNYTVGCYADDYIDIYYSRIMTSIRSNDFKTDFDDEYKLSILEGFLRRNLYILQKICHELEHAIQAQIAFQEPTNLEEKLIKIENFYLDHIGVNKIVFNIKDIEEFLSESSEDKVTFLDEIKYKLACFRENKIYDSNYDISLLERLADLDSLKKIYDMCESIKSEIPNLYILIDKIIHERKLRDYDTSFISPTTEFFINITGERQFYFPDYVDMSLEERLRLGLPVYNKELKEYKLKH